ncbi:unnamed protein product [Urochloa humidicola]
MCRSIHELSKRHGPLMSLRLGSQLAMVGASPDTARLLLRTHDLAFIDRPRWTPGRYTGYGYSDMLWSPYGAYWRQARRLWKSEIFSAARLRAHEHARHGEVRAMLRGLYAGGRSRRVVRLMDHLFAMNIDVISLMVPAAAATSEEFRWMIEEFFELSGVHSVGDMIPWLNWLDLHWYVRRMKMLRETIDRFLEHVVEEHGERRRREGDKFVATDMVDILLEHADDPSLEVPIQRDGVKAFTLVKTTNLLNT